MKVKDKAGLAGQLAVLGGLLSSGLSAEQAAWAAIIIGLVQNILALLLPTERPRSKVLPIALVGLTLMVSACSTATCERIKMSKVDLPEVGPKAAKVTYKCGKSTMSHTIKELPPCLRACWAEPDGQ